ncbi:MAG: hypothetical protein ACRDMX_06615 [Solirubrobacteraceae bacterium]
MTPQASTAPVAQSSTAGHRHPSTGAVWFAVLGGGIAWLVQFCTLIFFDWAQCLGTTHMSFPARWDLPMQAWEIGLSVAAIAVGLAATVQSIRIFRLAFRVGGDIDGQERRGDGSPPPLGRVHFLAIIALTVNFLSIVIVIMTGVGAPLLRVCHQA